jgi:hypothetical protein
VLTRQSADSILHEVLFLSASLALRFVLLFEYYRKLLFVAARNTICKITNEKIYRREKRKRGKTGKLHNDKDNYYLYRNFKDAMVFGMIASIHTFGRDLKWNPHIHYGK